MTLLQMLYTLLITPLSLLFETVYGASYILLQNCGTAIFPLSLAVNLLLLPFYRSADAIQAQERDAQARMAAGIAHIKKTFKGDERYMMLQAYYRVNHYKPLYALRSAVPLLLEIPFFIAAYRFLSELELLRGFAFGPINDLGRPDGLLKLGGVSVNLLPILMTIINLVSSEIYLRGLPFKEKLRLYAMALAFLALLYGSPSGLVIYWTLNNLFSLIKNLVNTSKNPARARVAAWSVTGALMLLFGLLGPGMDLLRRAIVCGLSLLFQIPALRALLPHKNRDAAPQPSPNPRLFLLGAVFLAVLTGLTIPSAVIQSSPAEFVTAAGYQSPLNHLLYSGCIAFGAFVVWLGIFYYLSSPRGKRRLEAAVWVASGLGVLNSMVFGENISMLTAQLQFEAPLVFTDQQLIVNAEVCLAVGVALAVLWKKREKWARAALPVMLLAVAGMSVYNMARIDAEAAGLGRIVEAQPEQKASIELSRRGKNVIVIMLDRAIDSFTPYLMNEKPELKAMFDGFTWYPNTLSYGPATNTGSPSLYGGYEYTPEALNARSDELLVDKHNEALKVMPVLFDKAGYRVTVCDPTYAGYTWIPDLSIYGDYPNIRAFHAESGSRDERFTVSTEALRYIWRRNFFCYGLMKASPLLVQMGLYQEGRYFNPQQYNNGASQVQVRYEHRATGTRRDFLDSYNVLCALPEITRFEDTEQNAFYMMSNSTTHNPMMLQEPQFEPAMQVDNTEYEQAHADRFTVEGRTIQVDSDTEVITYQSNMAAMLRLGRWFDTLRDAGIYDNTRIIIVADHGANLTLFEDTHFGPGDHENVITFNPLLLVKDFDAHGFSVDRQFMTNADTPTLAMAGLIDAPANPFTGRAIENSAKHSGEQHVFYTDKWQTKVNNGKKFLPGSWYAFTGDDIFDMSKWQKMGDD